MYTVEFYETADGVSELWDFLEELRLKSKKSKDARIQLKQIFLYIQLLQENGTRISDNITKHLGRRYLGTAPREQPGFLLLLQR